jgi:hypothetical protein
MSAWILTVLAVANQSIILRKVQVEKEAENFLIIIYVFAPMETSR